MEVFIDFFIFLCYNHSRKDESITYNGHRILEYLYGMLLYVGIVCMEKICILDKDWSAELPNPFSNDGVYGEHFSILKIDENVNVYMMGKSACGCFTLVLNPSAFDFCCRCSDFISYENSHGRCVLLHSKTFPVDTDFLNKLRYDFQSNEIRKTDTQYVVHSTTLMSYDDIIRDGCLKSPVQLKKQGVKKKAIGFKPLGEPNDYLDYIMFAPIDGMGSSSEIVVNSHMRGEICFDPNIQYTPQARMYFNGYKIIKDGLAVRDGVHPMKVKDSLSLSEYLLLTVFEKDVKLPKGNEYWTPTLFTEAANEYFHITVSVH